jgi:non-specific serine/threonine protein kinase
MTAPDASPGSSILADRYLLGPVLSSGGTGTVYRATDLRTGGPVAVKLPHPTLVGDPVHRERLRREALLAASLTSPRVVRVLDLGEHAGTPFLVLEYVNGETLQDRLHRLGQLPPREALSITLEVARALEAAHALGIVHRDLKPQNIILTEGQIKVLDFGIAHAEGLAELTVTGSFVGTPHYCAPEQAAGGGDVRSDIYSLGVILFALVEGHVPFNGPTPLAVLHQHATVPAPLSPDLPPAVRAVLERCLAKSPDDRYQTPAELVAALQGAIDAVPAAGTTAAGVVRGLTTGTPVALGVAATPAPLRGLPAPLTSLVGREQAVAEVRELLNGGQTGPRLLTLTGPGGAGKTRLALHVAGAARGSFPDGVALVELAAVTSADLVPDAVGGALGVPEVPGRPRLVGIVESLRHRRLLLLLDSCEHVVVAAAAVAEAVLRACPGVRILATSREALGVQGESVWQVPPLPAPEAGAQLPPERLAEYPAVRLFLDRVAAARPGFTLTPANAPAVAAICQRLDGLPLALELAAARARVLSVEQIAARLGDRFRLLSAGARTAPRQQQTLRAAMDWSYDLLGATERVLLRRLAVFAGGCDLAAAEAICAPEIDWGGQPPPAGRVTAAPDEGTEPGREPLPGVAVDDFDVLDGLQALVDKSLLTREETEAAPGGGAGAPRLAMLQTVREYALERLAASGEMVAIRDRQLAYFLDQAVAAEPQIRGVEQLEWLARLERDHDNLRAALEWSSASPPGAADGLRLAVALGWFWYLRGYRSEGYTRTVALLDLTAADEPAPGAAATAAAVLRARALGVAAHLAHWTGATRDAVRLAEAGEALARTTADPLTLAWALLFLAVVQEGLVDRDRLAAWWTEALQLFEAAGEPWGAALALSWRGQLAYERGETDPAERDVQDSLARFRILGDRWGIALVLARAAAVAELQGDLDVAERYWREQQTLARELGHRGAMAGGMSRQASLRLRRGDAPGAVTLFERSVALYRVLGERRTTAWPLAQLALLAARASADAGRARALLREALRVWQERDDLPGIASGLVVAAAIAAVEGPPERAARLAGAAGAALAVHGAAIEPVERRFLEGELSALRTELTAGNEGAAATWAAGETLTVEQALAEVAAG